MIELAKARVSSWCRAALLTAACALLPACWYSARWGMAVMLFSHHTLCPRERISVQEVPDAPPPPDIAADPQRLSMWQDRYGGTTLYRLDGCGQSEVYRCHRLGKCGVDMRPVDQLLLR
jgi:hypothetical protein